MFLKYNFYKIKLSKIKKNQETKKNIPFNKISL